MRKNLSYVAVLILGIVAGAIGYDLLTAEGVQSVVKGDVEGDEKKPLYWVAPMDPNYRRDKPGKSPMGMDLVPVYENGAAGAKESDVGVVRISPDVVNNLGVRTVMARRLPLQTNIKTVGYVQYDEDQLIHIHPRIEGWVEKLYVKAAGDPVLVGKPLYDIYSPALVNAQEELLLALERNNQRLIRAAIDRLDALQIPKATIRRLKKTKVVQRAVTIFAPQSGVVDNLTIREGFFVDPGTTMMSIGVLDEVWVRAEVFERQASLVKLGDEVVMRLNYLPGRSWRGQVDYIYPTLDEKTRTIQVRMRFANPDRALKPNMFAEVTIHSHDPAPTLLIPREAVIRTGGSNRVVLALGDGKFKSVAINIGRVTEDKVEVLAGLVPGEQVVSSAQFLLDSESSTSSDFKRMQHDDHNIDHSVHH